MQNFKKKNYKNMKQAFTKLKKQNLQGFFQLCRLGRAVEKIKN